MNEKIRHIYRTVFVVRFFCVLTGFYVVRAETALSAPVDYCHYTRASEIELVVSAEPWEWPQSIMSFRPSVLESPPKVLWAKEISAFWGLTGLSDFSARLLQFDRLLKFDTPSKQRVEFLDVPIDFSSSDALALYHYNHDVQHQLISFTRSFSPTLQLTSILQKHNIWHQSSDEDPSLSS